MPQHRLLHNQEASKGFSLTCFLFLPLEKWAKDSAALSSAGAPASCAAVPALLSLVITSQKKSRSRGNAAAAASIRIDTPGLHDVGISLSLRTSRPQCSLRGGCPLDLANSRVHLTPTRGGNTRLVQRHRPPLSPPRGRGVSDQAAPLSRAAAVARRVASNYRAEALGGAQVAGAPLGPGPT